MSLSNSSSYPPLPNPNHPQIMKQTKSNVASLFGMAKKILKGQKEFSLDPGCSGSTEIKFEKEFEDTPIIIPSIMTGSDCESFGIINIAECSKINCIFKVLNCSQTTLKGFIMWSAISI